MGTLELLIGGLISYSIEQCGNKATSSFRKHRAIRNIRRKISDSSSTYFSEPHILDLEDAETGLLLGEWLAERSNLKFMYHASSYMEKRESTADVLTEDARLRFLVDDRTADSIKKLVLESIDLCLESKSLFLSEGERISLSLTKRISDSTIEEVRDVVGKLDPGTSEEFQWNLYQRSLSNLEVPAYGLGFTGNKLYVPLCALEVSRVPELYSTIDQRLMGWLSSGEGERPIMFVSGDPGSGKTTVSRMFVRKVTRKKLSNVVFIRLRHFDETVRSNGLLASVIDYVNSVSMGSYKIDKLPSNKPLLLVLDGLDEVAARGKSTSKLANEMLATVLRFSEMCREEWNNPVKLLITTRTSLLPSLDDTLELAILANMASHLKLQPYKVSKVWQSSVSDEISAEGWSRFENWDGRKEWWKQYQNLTQVPQMDKYRDIVRWDSEAMITIQPVVNHLVASNASAIDFGRAPNRAFVYDQLLRGIIERRSEIARGDIVLHRSAGLADAKDHMRFLELAAMSAWHNTDRTTITDLKILATRCQSENSIGLFKKYQKGGKAFLNGIISSYLRPSPSTGNDEESYEFVHNSFMEYLIARSLSRYILANFGKPFLECSTYFLDVLSHSEITENTLDFLIDELVRSEAPKARELQNWFAMLFSKSLEPAFQNSSSSHFLGAKKETSIDRMICNLLTIHNLFAKRARYLREYPSYLETDDYYPIDGENLTRWIEGVLNERRSFASDLCLQLLSYIDARSFSYYSVDHADFKPKSQRSVLDSSTFLNIKMDGADFEESFLCKSLLEEITLQQANLNGVKATETRFLFADIQHTQMNATILRRSDWRSVKLDYSELSGADFQDASLHDVSITQANLECAHFCGTELANVDFSNSNLKNAAFINLILNDVNFSGASLDHAYFKNVLFAGRAFESINLEGAIIERQPLFDFLPSAKVRLFNLGPYYRGR